MDHVVIRRARADEADALTELAMRAKASWGYTPDFMAACRAELTFSPERMSAWTIWVAIQADTIVGTIALDVKPDGRTGEVEQFFVEPSRQGRGIGKALMAALFEKCRERGVTRLVVDSDPYAEGIYARFGFVRTGRSPSGSIPGRTLPRMKLTLD